MANIAYFDRFFQRRLSLRRQIVSAGSACVGNFLAQVQPAQANFQRRLSLRKKNKMANICRGLRKKIFFSPVLKSPTHIGFIGVKKMGQKSHTWAPLKYICRYILHTFVRRTYIFTCNTGVVAHLDIDGISQQSPEDSGPGANTQHQR